MSPQELQVQQKREIEKKQESTIPARSFVPTTDIFEADDALTIVLEMPGVEFLEWKRAEDGIWRNSIRNLRPPYWDSFHREVLDGSGRYIHRSFQRRASDGRVRLRRASSGDEWRQIETRPCSPRGGDEQTDTLAHAGESSRHIRGKQRLHPRPRDN